MLDRWESVLTRLGEDPMLASRELDWVTKLEILEGYRARDGLAWTHPQLQLVDLQYADIRPERGLYNRLAARGRMLRLVDEQDVIRAIDYPPDDTRAYFRGRCLRHYEEHKFSEIYDRIAFAAMDRYNEFENLRKAGSASPT